MSEEKKKMSDWIETGAMLLVLVAAVMGPQLRGMVSPPKRSSLMTLAPWIGALLTFLAFLLQVTWNASKVNSALAEQASAVASLSTRQEQHAAQALERERAAIQRDQQHDRIDQFLCNERRRDNQEAGRDTNGAGC
jgi:hypothetical protein